MTFISSQTVNNIDSKDDEAINNGGLTGQSAQTLAYYVDMNTFRRVSGYYNIGGTGPITLTVLASNDDVASTSANYIDVTNALFGAATFTADAFIIQAVEICCKWLKFNVVIGGVASDNAVDLVVRKGY